MERRDRIVLEKILREIAVAQEMMGNHTLEGFPDIAAHKYQTLRMEDVYETAVTDLPLLEEQIKELL